MVIKARHYKSACADVIWIQTQNDFCCFASDSITPVHYLLNFRVFTVILCIEMFCWLVCAGLTEIINEYQMMRSQLAAAYIVKKRLSAICDCDYYSPPQTSLCIRLGYSLFVCLSVSGLFKICE